MATKPLVLVLGNSHVYWLERLVASEVDFAPGSLREGLDCRIAFEGYRGGTVTTMEQDRGLRAVLINSTAWQQAWQTEICGGCAFVPHPAHILCDG